MRKIGPSVNGYQHPYIQESGATLVALFSALVVWVVAHGVHEPFPHRPTVRAVWITFHTFSIRLDFRDDEMGPGSF